MLFNLVLEGVVRKTNINVSKSLRTKAELPITYADDINIISRRLEEMRDVFQKLENYAKSIGLIVYESKTKYMPVPASNETRRSRNIFSNRE